MFFNAPAHQKWKNAGHTAWISVLLRGQFSCSQNIYYNKISLTAFSTTLQQQSNTLHFNMNGKRATKIPLEVTGKTWAEKLESKNIGKTLEKLKQPQPLSPCCQNDFSDALDGRDINCSFAWDLQLIAVIPVQLELIFRLWRVLQRCNLMPRYISGRFWFWRYARFIMDIREKPQICCFFASKGLYVVF